MVVAESTLPAGLGLGALSIALPLPVGALGTGRVAVSSSPVAPWADPLAAMGAAGVIALMDRGLRSPAALGRAHAGAFVGRVMSLAHVVGSVAHVVGSLGVRCCILVLVIMMHL